MGLPLPFTTEPSTNTAELTAPPVASTFTTRPSSGPSAVPIDPVDQPFTLTGSVRPELVQSGPFKMGSSCTFPKHDGRTCQYDHFNIILVNGEKVRRIWLIVQTAKGSPKELDKNAGHLLKVHEDGPTNVTTWQDLQIRLAKGLTIDKQEMELAEAEKRRWRDV
ncbi:unnamed protein product [Lepeophtheirus salmonis]|uniref:(salmon louse) hypothetical protein n=1 Tax=Lepeophtheirus salmonis TaxID=72036 RepID=A0A7R8HA74_LEPSM|nr:unnamed protein product [Lepeophtheirus salmonis]CAF2967692.1 unnamed protein product [Lepeophtheirus salmonis]